MWGRVSGWVKYVVCATGLPGERTRRGTNVPVRERETEKEREREREREREIPSLVHVHFAYSTSKLL